MWVWGRSPSAGSEVQGKATGSGGVQGRDAWY